MEKNTTKTEVREKIQELLKTLKAEQEKKPLRLVEQLGYLMYVRLFIESQKRVSLQESFPFAGFPMEWIPGEEEVMSTRPPAADAPYAMLMAPSSDSAWMNAPPAFFSSLDIYSGTSLCGVMG